LRCDLIRFIVGVIHPTNELLGSDIIPRWAIIGWLLTTCTNQVASSNAKLALFYDWLFFDPGKDNIMNIEPAILVMHHSMRPHPAITATLLDFLCRIITNFYPKEREKVHLGISNSLRTILDKRVLPTLQPLFDNPRLDEELRMMLKERFPQFVGKEVVTIAEESPMPHVSEDDPSVPRFSDEEDEVEHSPETAKNNAVNPRKKSKKKQRTESEKYDDQVLDDEVLEVLEELKHETKDAAKKCEIMDTLVRHACDKDHDFQQCSALASQLAGILQDEFEGRIFPTDPTPENIEDSIGKPIFVVFRWLCESMDGDQNRNVILTLLAELYTLQPRIGYYLLYFLSSDKSAGRLPKEKANVYKDLCEAIDEKYSLDICLVNDMRQCQEDDVNLFVHLVPETFTNFPKHSVGNTDLLYLVVSCVDGLQVQTLVCHIVNKEFIMFKKDSFGSIVNSSLSWETFEQYAMWQLASAHDLPVDCVVPLVPKLSYSSNPEALTNVLLLLKQERPTTELLKALLSREIEPGDRFVTSTLSYWMQEFDDKLGDLVGNILCKQASLGSNKRKRNHPSKGSGSSGANGAMSHAAELCLSHLDLLRQTCRQGDAFFSQNRYIHRPKNVDDSLA
jgi:integrator complex subunit 3